MSLQNWQENNTKYLTLALAWLRLRLERFAQPSSAVVGSATVTSPAVLAPVTSANVTSSWKQLFAASPTPQIPATSPTPSVESTNKNVDPRDQQLAQLESDLEFAASVEPPPALLLLTKQLGLTPFERNVLLLCAAMELDPHVAGLCARAQDNVNQAHPTFALALSLFDNPAWDVLSPDRPLRYWRLLEINQPGAQPLTMSALRADERIVSYINGYNALDDRLTPFLSPMEIAQDQPSELPPSQEAAVAEILNNWRFTSTQDRLSIVQLLGSDPISKQLVAARIASELGRQMYRLGAESLPNHSGELETLARLWHRESLLLPLALYLDVQDIETGSLGQMASIRLFLLRADGVILLGTLESLPRLQRSSFSIDIAKPTMAEQKEAWEKLLGEKATASAKQLAAQFNLDITAIEQVAGQIVNDDTTTEKELTEMAWTRCCAMTRPRLDALAQRIDPKATWEDLVLPPEQTALLHQIANKVAQRHIVYEEWGFAEKMNRGLGISVLFAGESGTGKTMAAEVIANALRLNLYRIDLSAVVSKYIGETEKNLRRLFDAAEDGCAILCFDEADALFGKRTEVKDSHDRYANQETSYLLQRIEAYHGLAILATNMIGAVDLAFMRRLSDIVKFPVPTAIERKMIWQKVFPRRVPVDELDYERLAALNTAGGNIQKIALNAAFRAAQKGEKVTMSTVLSAAQTVFRMQDKPINAKDFRV